MKRCQFIAVLVGFMAIVAFANTASAYYHPGMGRFLSRDPGPVRVGSVGIAAVGHFVQRDLPLHAQYLFGMNLYEYVNSTPIALTDPSGLMPWADGAHHPYPLHLGGSHGQPRIMCPGIDHQAAHKYFLDHGFGPGDPGRQAWGQLTARQQQAHVMRAMRAAGIPNSVIGDTIDDIMRNARPGTLTPRTGPAGRVVPVGGLVFSAALIVLTSPNTCYAAEIATDWRGNITDRNPTGNKECKCECADFVSSHVDVAWFVPGVSDSWTPEVRSGPWIDYGNMTAPECRTMEGSTTREISSSLSATHYETRTSRCRWGGVEHGFPK